MAFYVGQRVVCVDDSPFAMVGLPVPLVKGREYTVAGYESDDLVLIAEEPGWNSNGPSPDLGWRDSRFRPVIEREYDISIFKAMLNPSDERESMS